MCGQTGGSVICHGRLGQGAGLAAAVWEERRPCREISLCLEDSALGFFCFFFVFWRIPYHLGSAPPHVGQTDGLCSLPRISAISSSPRFPAMLWAISNHAVLENLIHRRGDRT